MMESLFLYSTTQHLSLLFYVPVLDKRFQDILNKLDRKWLFTCPNDGKRTRHGIFNLIQSANASSARGRIRHELLTSRPFMGCFAKPLRSASLTSVVPGILLRKFFQI